MQVNLSPAIESLDLNNASLNLAFNRTLTLNQDSVFSSGSILLNDNSSTVTNQARLRINGSLNFSGTGEVVFGTSNQNELVETNGSDVLTIASGMTIRTDGVNTKGTVFAGLTNNGLVDADGGELTI